MDGIDDDLEDEILMRVATRSEKNLSFETDGTVETQQDPEMTRVMQLTGGYVDFLRENANEMLASINFSDEALRQCARLGKFVAYVRARPSKLQEEDAEREFAARLVSQLIRLSKCLAVVYNKPTVDQEVLRITRKVALDTSRGQTYDMMEAMYDEGEDGIEPAMLVKIVNGRDSEIRKLLRFLRRIGAVETFEKKVKAKGHKGVIKKIRWRLTKYMEKLFQEINDIGIE
jgi:predicted fused transcriptional regulator/phosphomethylpyrimidine kinase